MDPMGSTCKFSRKWDSYIWYRRMVGQDWEYDPWEFDENQRIITKWNPQKVTVKIVEDETDCIEEVRENTEMQQKFMFRIDELNYIFFFF